MDNKHNLDKALVLFVVGKTDLLTTENLQKFHAIYTVDEKLAIDGMMACIRQLPEEFIKKISRAFAKDTLQIYHSQLETCQNNSI